MKRLTLVCKLVTNGTSGANEDRLNGGRVASREALLVSCDRWRRRFSGSVARLHV